MKRALITGITGQDGSYLAELLLDKDYEVHGMVRRVAGADDEARMWRVEHIREQLTLHHATLENYGSIYRLIEQVEPHELYHLAAQSFVQVSFEDEFSTMAANVNGTHHILSAVKDLVPHCRVYFAATSEMFGSVVECPQNEQTPLWPCSPYGISKVAGFHLTRHYREAYGLHASCGILFNHESPRRGAEFVTRKIARAAARIKRGRREWLRVGNISNKRDWGHAADYVRAMWLMLQQDRPSDYVVATGQTHSVEDLLDAAFGYLYMDWRVHTIIDPALVRPTDIVELRGDAEKARRELGWEPTVSFRELIHQMVDAERAELVDA